MIRSWLAWEASLTMWWMFVAVLLYGIVMRDVWLICVPFFANRSAFSFPETPQCDGIHCRCTFLPRCLICLANCLLSVISMLVEGSTWFAIAEIAALESLSMTTLWEDNVLQVSWDKAVVIALISPSKAVWYLPRLWYIWKRSQCIPAPVVPILHIWEPSV